MRKAVSTLHFAIFVLFGLSVHAADLPSTKPVPVLVELFTSEGCSSCPPADQLLQELDRTQPVAGAQIIVLSEHVDYWDSLGWKDPYSSHSLTERQSAYGDRFKLASVYTPQMIVDGEAEFTGGNEQEARENIMKAITQPAIPVEISSVTAQDREVKAHVEAGAGSGSVFIVVALNHAESQVLHGENGGHRLSHVAVVESMTKIGNLDHHKNFAKDVELKLPQAVDPSNLRIIAFVQKTGFNDSPGNVLGSALALPGR